MSSMHSLDTNAPMDQASTLTATSQLPIPQTKTELAAAQARAAKVFEDVASLPLGFKIWPPGAFREFRVEKSKSTENLGNTAIVSCHGNRSSGFNYSFHVSGATHFSQPGKETGNVLTFATLMCKVFEQKCDKITKAAQYAGNTLDRPLRKGEITPHGRNAAIKVATLLEEYHHLVSQRPTNPEPADVWTFFGTEDHVGQLLPIASQTDDSRKGSSAVSIPSINLYKLRSRKDLDSLVAQISKPNMKLGAMPFSVQWLGGKTPFVLMERQTDAATQNMIRLDEATRKRKREAYAAGHLSRGNGTPGTVSRNSASRVLTAATGSGSAGVTKSRGRSLKPRVPGSTRPNTEQFQQSSRMSAALAAQSEQVYGQYLTPYSLNPSLVAPVQDAQSLASPSAYQSHSGSISGDTSPGNHSYQAENFLHSASVSPGPSFASVFKSDTNDEGAGDFDFSNVSLDSESQAILDEGFKLATLKQYLVDSDSLQLDQIGQGQPITGLPSTLVDWSSGEFLPAYDGQNEPARHYQEGPHW